MYWNVLRQRAIGARSGTSICNRDTSINPDLDVQICIDWYYRYTLQLLTPASILASLAGRNQIELQDIDEMGELFLDAKTSAAAIGANAGLVS